MTNENRQGPTGKPSERKQEPSGRGQTAKDDGITRDDIEAGNDMDTSTGQIKPGRDKPSDTMSRKEH
jgi:hypothetical protein